ncbi:DUF2441 domain-containing protein [Ahrensia marina]|uniref:DUF2441 domain-containing protein n=1 Tax=Ahrensia marina TaxID=1514904 RepID=UPI0035CE97EE
MSIYYHCAPIPLAPGSVICPGNFGRVIRQYEPNFGNYPMAFRERVLEDVRAAEFPEKPSRLAAIFLLPSYPVAEKYLEAPERRSLIMYEVETIQEPKLLHVGDWLMALPEDDQAYFDGMSEFARQYWQGQSLDVYHQEILVDVPVRVLRARTANASRLPGMSL